MSLFLDFSMILIIPKAGVYISSLWGAMGSCPEPGLSQEKQQTAMVTEVHGMANQEAV